MSYDPAIGRFIEMDPIGMGDGPNEYEYVHDNPVNHVDPTGLDTQNSGPTTKPTSAGGEQITGNVDLILFAGDPTADYDGEKGVYDDLVAVGKASGIPVKVVKNDNDIANEVKAAYKNKPLNVVIFGHGSIHDGPLFGTNPNTRPIFPGWNDANLDCETVMGTKQEIQQYAKDHMKQAQADILKGDKNLIDQLNGKINSITFGGCSLAQTPAGQALLQIYANLLNAKITAFHQGVDENSDGKTFEFNPHGTVQPGFINEFVPQ